MNDFVSKSEIKNLEYSPYFLCPNNWAQSILYCLSEVYFNLNYPLKYEREVFEMKDKGSVAIDWVVDKFSGIPVESDKRPILVCFSGLSGGNDNHYIYSMMRDATKAGFKCVIINYRGTSGMKMTSKHFYWSNKWTDAEEPLNYLSETYGR